MTTKTLFAHFRYLTKIKRATTLLFILLLTIGLSGCGIPDLPGPIGIPGF